MADSEKGRGGSTPKPLLLLLEPYFVLRHTVASVAREMGLAEVVEATSVEGATHLLEGRAFDACLVALSDDRHELALIQRLREGALLTDAETPVAVTTEKCDAGMILALKELHVSRIVLKPFKVRTLLDTLAQMVADLPERPRPADQRAVEATPGATPGATHAKAAPSA